MTLLRTLTLLLATAVGVAACSGSSSDNATPGDENDITKSALFACQTDSDCIAVDQVGCCHNGYQAAVNKNQKEAYLHSFVCKEQVSCPQFLVHDTRVPQCNVGASKCQMVEID